MASESLDHLDTLLRASPRCSPATSDQGREGTKDVLLHLPKRAKTSTPAKAQRPRPVPALARAFDPKADVQIDAPSAAEQAPEDSCAKAADRLRATRCSNCAFAMDSYDESRRFCCQGCSFSGGKVHDSRCLKLVAAAFRRSTEAQTDSQVSEAAIARSVDAEAQTEPQ